MADVRKDVETVSDPLKIKKALLASSPYVLRKVFAGDPTIMRLVSAREQALSYIAEKMKDDARLSEITLAAFAYIVESVDASSAPKIFAKRFRKAVEAPGPFFVHFAAHAIRVGMKRPVKPLEMVYSRAELLETLEYLPRE